MAHLAPTYTSYEEFLNRADAFWTVEFDALNSSGVDASVPGHGFETAHCAVHAAILTPVAALGSRVLCSALI